MVKIIRIPKVAEKVGILAVHIRRLAKARKFPRPLRLGPAMVGWIEDEIDEWMLSRPRVGEEQALDK